MGWRGGKELTYDGLVLEAIRCCHEGLLWRDADFPCAGELEELGEHVHWKSLADIFGWPPPHVWPDGRRSYLYSYSHHASELHHAPPPGHALQGNLGDCYLLSAVAAVIGSRCGAAVRRDLIDESLEPAGIYGVSLFVNGRWRMVWVDGFFPCEWCDDDDDDDRAGSVGGGGCRRDRERDGQRLSGRTLDGDGGGGQWTPVFARSAGACEAWLMVVEKA